MVKFCFDSAIGQACKDTLGFNLAAMDHLKVRILIHDLLPIVLKNILHGNNKIIDVSFYLFIFSLYDISAIDGVKI